MRLENDKLMFFMTFLVRALRNNLPAAFFVEHPVYSRIYYTNSINHISALCSSAAFSANFWTMKLKADVCNFLILISISQ